jgi:hypothetical protein
MNFFMARHCARLALREARTPSAAEEHPSQVPGSNGGGRLYSYAITAALRRGGTAGAASRL